MRLLVAPAFLLLPVLAQAAPHNLILFVPDGLRSQVVEHTTANASASATGHRLGDTGDFSNTI